MDIFEGILSRRSIRKYTPDPISDELIKNVIKAGMSAPSAGNQQPWQYVVIRDRTLLDTIPDFHPNASLLRGAPVAILVCGDLSREKYEGYWILDCSAATENMLLAVHGLGLGGCWLGIYPREERIHAIRTLLKLPDNIVPFSLISVGVADEKKGEENRFDPNLIHINSW